MTDLPKPKGPPNGPEPLGAGAVSDLIGRDEDAADAALNIDRAAEVPISAPQPRPGIAPDLSHDALALELGTTRFDRDFRHVAAWGGAWLIWDGYHWRIDTKLEAVEAARSFLRNKAASITAFAEIRAAVLDEVSAKSVRKSAQDGARNLRQKPTVASVLDLARSNPGSAATASDFDRDPLLLGTPGGTVDLRTGELRKARRNDLITRIAGFKPEHGKPSERLRFLDTAFDGDTEVIDFLRRALGYSLTGDTREHKLFFAFGNGANGKSTFLNAMLSILGTYGRRAPATTLMSRHVEGHPTDLAGLAGARLAVASELPRGASWNEAVIKDLTGGDKITARFMRGDFFDFTPVLKLWVAGNTMPSFRGVDEAIRRRVVVLPFTMTVPSERRDPTLPGKLAAEYGLILSWAIEGALEWQSAGLQVPASIVSASHGYLDDEDVIGLYLAEQTEPDTGAFTTTTDLYVRFCQWTDGQGLPRWSMLTFQKEVAAHGFQATRRNFGRGFVGLRLRRG
jgi:putative DNA primase/helicase